MSQEQSLLEALVEEEVVTQVAAIENQDAKMSSESSHDAIENQDAEETSESRQQKIDDKKWLKPFLADKKLGLEAFVKEIAHKQAPNLALAFRNALFDVIESHAEAQELNPNAPPFPDKLGLVKEFDNLEKMRANGEATHADIEKQNSKVDCILQRCFAGIYYIGQYTFPSMYFCGSVEPDKMTEEGTFFGYNERQVHTSAFVFPTTIYRKNIFPKLCYV